MKMHQRCAIIVSGLLVSTLTIASVTQGHADDVAPPRDPTDTTTPSRAVTAPTTTSPSTATTSPPRAVLPPISAQPAPPSLPPDDPNPDIPYPCPQDPICDWGTFPPLPKPAPPSLPPENTLVVGNPCEEDPELCKIPPIPTLPQPKTSDNPLHVKAAATAAHAMLQLFVATFVPPQQKGDTNGCAWVYIPFVGWHYYCPPSPPSGPGGAGDNARARDFIDLA